MPDIRQKEIAKFDRNSAEEVVISLTTFSDNKECLDIRIWVKPELYEGAIKSMPTKKGLTISLDLIPDLIEGLQKAQAIYEK